MRIAYALYWHFGAGSGVFEKARRQVTAWRELGHQVEVHVATSDEAIADWRSVGQVVTAQTWRGNGVGNLRAKAKVLGAALDRDVDVVYVRYSPPPPWPPLGRTPPPVAVEINTDDRLEYRAEPLPKRLFNASMRRRLLRRADLAVCVTNELASTYEHHAPTAVVANGIDLENIPVGSPPDNEHVRAVFVSPHRLAWHGLDRVTALATARPGWRIDVVGLDGTPGAPPNVTWHGVLGQRALTDLLRRADVGIGTLALHRKGMHEACPLKTREYLAHGLPAIIAYRDTDFPDGADFLLQLPNAEGNVVGNLDTIDDFVARWRGRRVERRAIRHLDIREKERRRLSLLQQAVSNVRDTQRTP